MTNYRPVGILRPTTSRASLWMRSIGTLEVPLKSAFPQRAFFPAEGTDDTDVEKMFFWVDVERLDVQQIKRLAKTMAKEFKRDVGDVLDDIERRGIPVLSDDITVVFDGRFSSEER